MPRDPSGVYDFPAGSGNPVQTGTTISTNWANPTLDDIKNTLTASLDRNGSGAMLAPIRGPDGSPAAPTFSFSDEVSSGRYRAGPGQVVEVIQGTNVVRYTATGIEQWTGTEWEAITRQNAEDVPFDNTGTSFVSTDVQDVLALELDTLYPVVPIANGGTASTTATGSGETVLATNPTMTDPVGEYTGGSAPPLMDVDDNSNRLITSEWFRRNITMTATGVNANGYWRLYSDGYIIQWGKWTSGLATKFENFATSFSNAGSVTVFLTQYSPGSDSGAQDYISQYVNGGTQVYGGWPVYTVEPLTSGVNISRTEWGDPIKSVHYLAMGY